MKKYDTKKLVLLALLTGLLVLMAFTPIGYLNIGPLSITFNMIPVAIGAVALGPTGSAVLGLVFGITSFAQCFGISAFGTVLCGISPLLTLIVTIGRLPHRSCVLSAQKGTRSRELCGHRPCRRSSQHSLLHDSSYGMLRFFRLHHEHEGRAECSCIRCRIRGNKRCGRGCCLHRSHSCSVYGT